MNWPAHFGLRARTKLSEDRLWGQMSMLASVITPPFYPIPPCPGGLMKELRETKPVFIRGLALIAVISQSRK